MPFTPAELAEMERADAEIEASFCITNDEISFGRLLDRDAVLENMDTKRRKVAEQRRQYYEANKEKVAEYQRQYREANKEKVAEGKTAIRNLRAELRLSQKDFGAMFGVTQVTVSYWENISAPANWIEIVASYSAFSKE